MHRELEAMVMPEEETVEEFAFTAPAGFAAPEDVREGDAFEVVAKVRLRDGQLVFDQINGVSLAAEPETEDEEIAEVEVEEEPVEEDLMTAARESGYA